MSLEIFLRRLSFVAGVAVIAVFSNCFSREAAKIVDSTSVVSPKVLPEAVDNTNVVKPSDIIEGVDSVDDPDNVADASKLKQRETSYRRDWVLPNIPAKEALWKDGDEFTALYGKTGSESIPGVYQTGTFFHNMDKSGLIDLWPGGRGGMSVLKVLPKVRRTFLINRNIFVDQGVKITGREGMSTFRLSGDGGFVLNGSLALRKIFVEVGPHADDIGVPFIASILSERNSFLRLRDASVVVDCRDRNRDFDMFRKINSDIRHGSLEFAGKVLLWIKTLDKYAVELFVDIIQNMPCAEAAEVDEDKKIRRPGTELYIGIGVEAGFPKQIMPIRSGFNRVFSDVGDWVLGQRAKDLWASVIKHIKRPDESIIQRVDDEDDHWRKLGLTARESTNEWERSSGRKKKVHWLPEIPNSTGQTRDALER
ncbi:hypothetical protein HOD08_02745 [bacterium]|nr:hypothetical protein [bacterium]